MLCGSVNNLPNQKWELLFFRLFPLSTFRFLLRVDRQRLDAKDLVCPNWLSRVVRQQ